MLLRSLQPLQNHVISPRTHITDKLLGWRCYKVLFGFQPALLLPNRFLVYEIGLN